MSSLVLEDGSQQNQTSKKAPDVGDGPRICLVASQCAFASRVCIIDCICMWRGFAGLWTSLRATCEYSRARLQAYTKLNRFVNTLVLNRAYKQNVAYVLI